MCRGAWSQNLNRVKKFKKYTDNNGNCKFPCQSLKKKKKNIMFLLKHLVGGAQAPKQQHRKSLEQTTNSSKGTTLEVCNSDATQLETKLLTGPMDISSSSWNTVQDLGNKGNVYLYLPFKQSGQKSISFLLMYNTLT